MNQQQDHWQNLEDHLNVPFFYNLREIVAERVKTLNDHQALDYLFNVIQGFENRHPEFEEVFSTWLIEEAVGVDRWKQINQLFERNEEELGLDETDPKFGIWIVDFVRACGGEHYLAKSENGEDIVHRKGLVLLEEVFDGDQN